MATSSILILPHTLFHLVLNIHYRFESLPFVPSYDIVVKFKTLERPLNIHGFPQFLDQLIIIPKGKKLEGLQFRNQEFFFSHTFLDHPNIYIYIYIQYIYTG